MASVVTICNAALQLVKHSKTITSLEQGTREANACVAVFDELRDAIYEMHNWNFAIKRVKLGQLTTAPVFGFEYSYQLPSDFIRLVSAHRGSHGRDNAPYAIEGSTIAADVADLYIVYVARISDPNMMSAGFRLALSKLLASRLAVALTQSPSLSKELYDQFLTQDLPTAKSSDSLQSFVTQMPESDWITVRNGGVQNYEPGDPPA